MDLSARVKITQPAIRTSYSFGSLLFAAPNIRPAARSPAQQAAPSLEVPLYRCLLSALFSGTAEHPLAQVDKRVLMPTGHRIGQPAQLDGKLLQILS